MIEQQGKVVEVRGDRASIRIGTAAGCAACASGRGCGAGIFAKLWRRKPILLTVENSISARPGEIVIVGISETTFLRVVARVYFLPLLAALVGGILGQWFAGTWAGNPPHPAAADLGALSGAVLSCGLCLWSLRFLPGRPSQDINVKLLRMVTSPSGTECGNQLGVIPL